MADVLSTLEELGWLDRGGITESGKTALAVLLEGLPSLHKGSFGPAYVPLMSRIVPAGVELVIVRRSEGRGEVLLCWRHDEYFRGWHLPGSHFSPREDWQDAVSRCSLKEVGVKARFVRALASFNQRDTKRFHDFTTLVLCELEVGSEHGRWFRDKPADLLDVHEKYWPTVESVLRETAGR